MIINFQCRYFKAGFQMHATKPRDILHRAAHHTTHCALCMYFSQYQASPITNGSLGDRLFVSMPKDRYMWSHCPLSSGRKGPSIMCALWRMRDVGTSAAYSCDVP